MIFVLGYIVSVGNVGNKGNRFAKPFCINDFRCSPACSPSQSRLGNKGNKLVWHAENALFVGRTCPTEGVEYQLEC